jgi:hypothetical protein
MVELNVNGEVVTISVDRIVNAGYSGRDEGAVQDHINELVEDGVDVPDSVPTTYKLAPNTLLVDPGTVQVVGKDTSGEAEFGLLAVDDEVYVVAASDQTDRNLEPENIQKSKQVAPNVVSQLAWRLSEVRDQWDCIEIRAWNTVGGERQLYQDTTLAAILEPEALLDIIRERYGGPLGGTAVLSGTVATVGGKLTPGSTFEAELVDTVRDRSLSVAYDVKTM